MSLPIGTQFVRPPALDLPPPEPPTVEQDRQTIARLREAARRHLEQAQAEADRLFQVAMARGE